MMVDLNIPHLSRISQTENVAATQPYAIPDEHKIDHPKPAGDETRFNLMYGYMWGKLSD